LKKIPFLLGLDLFLKKLPWQLGEVSNKNPGDCGHDELRAVTLYKLHP